MNNSQIGLPYTKTKWQRGQALQSIVGDKSPAKGNDKQHKREKESEIEGLHTYDWQWFAAKLGGNVSCVPPLLAAHFRQHQANFFIGDLRRQHILQSSQPVHLFRADEGTSRFNDGLFVAIDPGRIEFRVAGFHHRGYRADDGAQLTAAKLCDLLQALSLR